MKKYTLLLILILFLFTSCRSLQKQKGYNKYQKNTDWYIDKN